MRRRGVRDVLIGCRRPGRGYGRRRDSVVGRRRRPSGNGDASRFVLFVGRAIPCVFPVCLARESAVVCHGGDSLGDGSGGGCGAGLAREYGGVEGVVRVGRVRAVRGLHLASGGSE